MPAMVENWGGAEGEAIDVNKPCQQQLALGPLRFSSIFTLPVVIEGLAEFLKTLDLRPCVIMVDHYGPSQITSTLIKLAPALRYESVN
jgi:hypothetical protein